MLLLICGLQARTVVPSFNFLRLLGCSGEPATVRNILKPRELRRYLTIVGRLKVARQRDTPTAVGKPVRGNVCAFTKYSEIGFKCLVPFFSSVALFSAGIPGLWVWGRWLPNVIRHWGVSLWYICNSFQHKRRATSSRYHAFYLLRESCHKQMFYKLPCNF